MISSGVRGVWGAAARGELGGRVRVTFVLAMVLVVVLVGRLAWVQVVWGPDFAAQAQEQRTRTYVQPAKRGEITDRNGNVLAFTMHARSLTVNPIVLRKEITQRHETYPKHNLPVEEELPRIANGIERIIVESGAESGGVDASEILEKLRKDTHYEVLVRNVDPDIAAAINSEFTGIAADHQDVRHYPNGAIAENIIGKVDFAGDGQFGYEIYADSQLSGSDGRLTEQVSEKGHSIPGTFSETVPVINGSDVALTIDLDLQTFVQQQIEQAKMHSGARSVEAVVLDAKTAEVLAMANTDTIDPTGNIVLQQKKGRSFGNPAVSNPFEPGSVAKIITAAAAIEDGKTHPEEVHPVPGSIHMAGVTVKDAWPHGVVNFTTAGIFGKSSNVGTLMLAERVGPERFAEMLGRFGVGKPTHIELPGESQGVLLPLNQWTGGTFANLPIGQGMSMTTLQMANMYQAVANDGERVEPRIVKKITQADGTVITPEAPPKTRVISPETAATLRHMFQAVTQFDPTGRNTGTGPAAAIEGYQIAGKTGTAQQVDPSCNCYSNSKYWITFAGIAPADNPRYVIALMMDNPQRGPHGEGGQSAAPLFHDIAAFALNHGNVPLSPPAGPHLELQH